MKRCLLFFSLLSLMGMYSGCKNSGNAVDPSTVEQIAETPVTEVNDVVNELMKSIEKPSFLFSEDYLPKNVDLKQDISGLNYAELRVLRSYPYAIHGYWFKEADLNGFFTNKTEWYANMCNEDFSKRLSDFYEKMDESGEDWDADEYEINFGFKDYSSVQLTKEEQAFVDKIDKRMKELKASSSFSNGLQNPLFCVNLYQMQEPDRPFVEGLAKNNFSIAATNNQQLFNVYEENDYLQMPSFITTDVYLQAFHMYFSYVLKSLEIKQFVPALTRFSKAMYDEAISEASHSGSSVVKDCAEYNATFYAIMYKLLTDQSLSVPAVYKNLYEEECTNALEAKDNTSVFLGFTEQTFPYSLFKPRGHYTRNEVAKRYFRAMMWLQSAPFCRDDRTSISRAVCMAQIFNALSDERQKDIKGVGNVITFLMGEPDNIAIMELAEHIQSKGYAGVGIIEDDNIMGELNQWLVEQFKTRNKIAPKIQISCADKLNFMPQRYMADNEVLATMYDEKPNSGRPFPKALDVFSAFGVTSTDAILKDVYQEPSNWTDYEKEAKRMKDQFASGINWDATMYNKWMQSLVEMQKTDKQYPSFMKTTAWGHKNLQTALASWAELKHDAILYGEQPFAAECGDGDEGLPTPVVVGFVEPNLNLWNKMKELLALNKTMLQDAGLLTEDLASKTESLEESVDFCLSMVNKELKGEPLTDEDYLEINTMGSSLEWFTLSVLDPDEFYTSMEYVQGADKSVAVVADVFTRNVRGCDKCGILYEATGNADAIYVLVEIGGQQYLTRGATFSYYEFVQPLGDRLTDEQWQEMIEKGEAPKRPEWIRGYILNKKPEENEAYFYSSGC